MREKSKRVVIDRWPSYTDVCGGARFINGVSEPVTALDATRLAAALSARVVDADAYSPDEWKGITPAPEDAALVSCEGLPLDEPTEGVHDTPVEPARMPEKAPDKHEQEDEPSRRDAAASRASKRGGSKPRG
ncbi:hypothetical protein D3C72_721570 [compost metagenome]